MAEKEVLINQDVEKNFSKEKSTSGQLNEFIQDVEEKRKPFVPREVRNWMEKVELDPDQNKQGQQQGDDDSILQPITKTPKIVLPTDRKTFSDGFNKKMTDAGRWLSEFVFRLIKKNNGKVKFKEE